MNVGKLIAAILNGCLVAIGMSIAHAPSWAIFLGVLLAFDVIAWGREL